MKKILYFLGISFFYSCANMVTPNGGKKDDKIPQLIKSNLQLTNFKDHSIRLQFSEYIALNNPSVNITVQPKNSPLDITLNGKFLNIGFDSLLKENTTYLLNIDKGIKDVNEENLYSLSYIFSTGENIDTNFAVYNIDNFSSLKSIKIGLTNLSKDSLKDLLFDYIYPLNNSSVVLKGLGSNLFKTWIFTDINNDNIPDQYAPIYYDTIEINSTKNISLNNWSDSKNKRTKNYSTYTKIFKPIDDELTYGLKNVIYIDKDSALFYNLNSDTLPKLNLKGELELKLHSVIKTIKTDKDYNLIIDKCGIRNLSLLNVSNYKEDQNYFYITSKLKIDSVLLQVKVLNDSFYLKIKIDSYAESNKMSSLKISKNEKYKDLIIYIYKEEKLFIVKNINIQNDCIFYLNPGKYQVQIYNTNFYRNLSFDYLKLKRINTPIIKREILLKPNWDEVLQLFF